LADDFLDVDRLYRKLLQPPTCEPSASPARLSGAIEAANRIPSLLEGLKGQIGILATAVRPDGIRDRIDRAANLLGRIRSGKTWLREVDDYCGTRGPDWRTRLREEIAASVNLVDGCHRSLGALIDGLA
jgi:hypothetical protein